MLLDSEEPLPVWQVRNQYYWTWDFAQFLIELPVDSKSTKFKLLIIAERGDNDGKVLIRKKKIRLKFLVRPLFYYPILLY